MRVLFITVVAKVVCVKKDLRNTVTFVVIDNDNSKEKSQEERENLGQTEWMIVKSTIDRVFAVLYTLGSIGLVLFFILT